MSDTIYQIGRAELKEAAQVRHLFDDIAARNDTASVERFKYLAIEGHQQGVEYLPPVPSVVWSCVVQPYIGDDVTPVLAYNYVTRLRRDGELEYRSIFLAPDEQTGKLSCMSADICVSLEEMLAESNGRAMNRFEKHVVKLAAAAHGLKGN
jgi:hypothetical protein